MYRRLMSMAGATALTVGGLGAVLAMGGTAFAAGTPSSPYTIGYAVSGVTFASTSSVGNASANYTLGFVMPSNVDTSTTTLTLSGLPVPTSGATLPSTAIVTDTTSGSTQVLTFAASSNGGSITLDNAVAGDNYTVVLDGAVNAKVASSTTYSPAIEVGTNDVGTAATFTLTPASTAAAATAAASTNASLASATDTFSGFAVATNGTASSSSSPYMLYVDFSANSQTYPTAPSDYAVQVTSNGHTTADSVSAVGAATDVTTGSTSGGYYIPLTLGSVIPAGATVSVTIDGAVNVSSPTETYVSLYDSTNGGGIPTAAEVPTSTTGSNDAGFLAATNLSSTLAVNPTGNGDTSTWSTSFTVPSGYTSATTTVTPTLSGGSLPSPKQWAVFDATNSAGNSSGTGTVTLNSTVAAGDSITIDYYGVTNSSSASSASVSFTVGSAYTYSTNSVSLTSVPTSPVNVVPSDPTPGATANYTVSGIAAPSGGITATTSSTAGGSIVLTFPSGTVLPGAVADYTLKDLTTPSSSGVYSGAGGVSVSGTTVTLETQNTIAAGDNLQLTITGVINPTAASNTDVVDYTGVVAAAQQVTTVPTAATTYPNGALIQHGGQIDVVAGGYAFGIPSPTVFGKIKAMDMSSVVSGTFPTTTTPAPGTLINPVGTAGYWVVGANGDIYPFSSMTQFKKDGYVVSQVIPVPNTGGLTVGAGTPPTAATTMANGALVQFGTTIYEYAGGIATGISTPSELASIEKMTGGMVVQGSGSTPTSASTSENGTLVQPLGKAGVWVNSGGTLYQFMSASQFKTDGYSFQYVLPIATVGSYTVSSF